MRRVLGGGREPRDRLRRGRAGRAPPRRAGLAGASSTTSTSGPRSSNADVAVPALRRRARRRVTALAARAKARDAYARLVADGRGWQPAVRDPLADGRLGLRARRPRRSRPPSRSSTCATRSPSRGRRPVSPRRTRCGPRTRRAESDLSGVAGRGHDGPARRRPRSPRPRTRIAAPRDPLTIIGLAGFEPATVLDAAKVGLPRATGRRPPRRAWPWRWTRSTRAPRPGRADGRRGRRPAPSSCSSSAAVVVVRRRRERHLPAVAAAAAAIWGPGVIPAGTLPSQPGPGAAGPGGSTGADREPAHRDPARRGRRLMGALRTRPSPEILSGESADVYFARAESILEREGLDPLVVMEVFSRQSGVLCGIDEAKNLLAHVLGDADPSELTVEALDDGDTFSPQGGRPPDPRPVPPVRAVRDGDPRDARPVDRLGDAPPASASTPPLPARSSRSAPATSTPTSPTSSTTPRSSAAASGPRRRPAPGWPGSTRPGRCPTRSS